MRPLAVVIAVGARTPAGLRAVDCGFSFRASAAIMRPCALVDPDGEPVTMCFQPTIEPLAVGFERALALAAPALDEVLLQLGPVARTLRARLLLATEEGWGRRDPGGRPRAARLCEDLVRRAQASLAEVGLEVATRGAASAAYLLPGAIAALDAGTIDLAIVGGVHTDYDPERIADLAAAGRLFRPDRRDAMIPGEHAAFFALCRAEVARRLGLSPLASILAVETGEERARPDNDESAYAAAGLTAALRRALGRLGDVRVGWMLNDLSFETFRHAELHSAALRTQKHFCEPQRFDSPAQRIGHLGAAALPLHVVLASEGFRRGWAPHPVCVAVAGSDGGERGIIVAADPG